MTLRDELLDVLCRVPAGDLTVRVPRALLLGILHSMYREDEFLTATERATADAKGEPWPPVVTGQDSYRRDWTLKASFPSAGSPSKGGGSVSLKGGAP